MSIRCYKCNYEFDLKVGSDIGRREDCPSCFVDIRCCKMCEFYDRKSYNECRESTAERIVDKEKANFCSFFKLGKTIDKEKEKNDLLSAADALFKK